MPPTTTAAFLSDLHRWRADLRYAHASDPQLLDRYAEDGDPAAFTLLMERHGPLVLGVCRRLLSDPASADDAFQATFLALARSARTIRRRGSVAGWLYGVARRIAGKARLSAARRRRHEAEAAARRPAASSHDPGWLELLALLDEELQRLPDRHRAPLILCYLEGRTQDESATLLGWSLATFRRRLQRGRALLRVRLDRRGATLSAALFATFLSAHGALADPPPRLACAALKWAIGQPAPQPIADLAAGLLATTGVLSTRSLGLALFILTTAAGGVGLINWSSSGSLEDVPTARPADQRLARDVATGHEREPVLEPPVDKVDQHGDPLPHGVLFRVGTLRFRHANGAVAAALAPDGRAIATLGHDALRVLDLESGKVRVLVRIATGPSRFGACSAEVAFSPTGKVVATGNRDGTATLWDAQTGQKIVHVEVHDSPVRSVTFSHDGKTLFTVSEKGQMRSWDAATGAEQGRGQHGGSLLVVSPDGNTVAVSGGREEVVDLRSPDGKVIASLVHDRAVTRVAFSPDGKQLATATEGRLVRVWDTATGEPVAKLVHPLPEGSDEFVTALAYTPDGRGLATGASDGSLRMWDSTSGESIRDLKGHVLWVTGLGFTPDGKELVSVGGDSTVRRWDAATGREVTPNDEAAHHQLARSPDGKLLATTGPDGFIHLWDVPQGTPRARWSAHPGGVLAVVFSPDGKRVASVGRDKFLRVWNLDGRVILAREALARATPVGCLAYSPDGRVLAVGCSIRGSVSFYDAVLGYERRRLTHPKVSVVAFAPNGREVATGGFDQVVRLWDATNADYRRAIRAEPAEAGPGRRPPLTSVHAMSYSPDGQSLAVGYHDGTLRLWNPATGQEAQRLKSHSGVVCALSFSRDGRWLATGGADRTIALWEAATGQEMHRLRGHEGSVTAVVLGPDAATVASCGLDTTALVWTLKTAAAGEPADEKKLATALGGNATSAFEAHWRLTEHPDVALRVLLPQVRSLAGRTPRDSRGRLPLGPAGEEPAAAPGVLGQHAPDAVRQSRILHVLERIATPEAYRLMQLLARASPDNPRLEIRNPKSDT